MKEELSAGMSDPELETHIVDIQIQTPSYAAIRKLLLKSFPKGTARDKLLPRIVVLGKTTYEPDRLAAVLDQELSNYADEHIMEGMHVLAFNNYSEQIVQALAGNDSERELLLGMWRSVLETRLTEQDQQQADPVRRSKPRRNRILGSQALSQSTKAHRLNQRNR